MNKLPVAIVGASGYSGEELIQLLSRHPFIELVCVTSRQHEGKRLADVQHTFNKHPQIENLVFSPATAQAVVDSGAQIAFLALPHGLASEFARPLLEAGLRVIDLSADFRVKDAAIYKEFYGQEHPEPDLLEQSVYGMPEIRREIIKDAKLIASPGCYPTSVLLPLIPLLKAQIIQPDTIIVNSVSGLTGAGRKANEALLFAECNESVRAYGLPKHRHLSEIEQELSIAAGELIRICFHPHLVPIDRGIHTTIAAKAKQKVTEEILTSLLETAYSHEPFVRLLGTKGFPDTKDVARTNFLDMAWRFDSRTNTVVLLSAEDNLVKGAGGQGIQSLNIMQGWDETTGLL